MSGGAFLLSAERLSVEAVVEEVAADEAGAVAGGEEWIGRGSYT